MSTGEQRSVYRIQRQDNAKSMTADLPHLIRQKDRPTVCRQWHRKHLHAVHGKMQDCKTTDRIAELEKRRDRGEKPLKHDGFSLRSRRF